MEIRILGMNFFYFKVLTKGRISPIKTSTKTFILNFILHRDTNYQQSQFIGCYSIRQQEQRKTKSNKCSVHLLHLENQNPVESKSTLLQNEIYLLQYQGSEEFAYLSHINIWGLFEV